MKLAAIFGMAGALLTIINRDVFLPFCLFCIIVAVMDILTKKPQQSAVLKIQGFNQKKIS